MKPRFMSMSALPRTFACPTSFVLPWTANDNEYSDSGTAGHSEMESAVLNWELDKLPPEVAPLLAEYRREHVMIEQPIYYNFLSDESRLGVKSDDRDYKPLPFEIPGKSDVMAVDVARRRGLVIDWKQFEEVGAAISNSQTTGYAVALARLFDLDEVTVVIAYLSPANRHVDIAVLDDLDFMAYGDRLRQLQLDVAGARAQPSHYLRLGRHCRWCPAYFDCDEQKTMQLQLAAENAMQSVEQMLPLDDDDAALAAFNLRERVSIFNKRLNEALFSRAARRPIPLADGRFFGKVEKQGDRELNADTVYAVVKAQHGQDVADAAVERVATFTKLKAALKSAGVKSVAKAEKQVIDVVAEQGGVSRKTTMAIEVTTADKLLDRRPVSPEVIDAANKLLTEVA